MHTNGFLQCIETERETVSEYQNLWPRKNLQKKSLTRFELTFARRGRLPRLRLTV